MTRLMIALLLLTAACGGSSGSPRTTRITVFAAASLTDVFRGIATEYDDSHPGSSVTLSFAGSQSLVAQVQQGAPADVLATADRPTIEKVADELRGAPTVFAHNRLAVICRTGLTCSSLHDLTKPGLRVVLGGPTVPVGKATAKALRAAAVTVHPVSLEPDVRSVLQKVRTGEADAGVVYATDLASAHGSVTGAPVTGTETTLAVGALTTRGEGFAAYLLTAPAQRLLTAAGFTAP